MAFLFILLVSINLSGCKPAITNHEEETLPAPVYEVKIPDTLPETQIVQEFLESTYAFFKMTYPDLQFVRFVYTGDQTLLGQQPGKMKIQFLATKKDGLIPSPVFIQAIYTPAARQIAYYVEPADQGPDRLVLPLSIEEFNALVPMVTQYLQNLGVKEGLLQMTEEVEENVWVVEHFKSEGQSADLSLRIKIGTLELLEYLQNP